MKTERRHDLQTNWLADYLGKKLEQIKPYTNLIITGVFGVLAIVAIWSVWSWYSRGSEEQAWNTFETVISPTYASQEMERETSSIREEIKLARAKVDRLRGDSKRQRELEEAEARVRDLERDLANKQQAVLANIRQDIQEVGEEFADSPAGWAATLHLADQALQEGAQGIFTSPGVAKDRLTDAINLYQRVKDNVDDRLLRERAQFGLARAYETRNQRDDQHEDRDDRHLAIAEYKQLAEESIAYGPQARRRLAMLRSTAKKPFYEWFDEQVEKRLAERKSTGALGNGNSDAGTP